MLAGGEERGQPLVRQRDRVRPHNADRIEAVGACGGRNVGRAERAAVRRWFHGRMIADVPAEIRPDLALKHDPEKWELVFGKDHARAKI
jgi:hypothetical protein